MGIQDPFCIAVRLQFASLLLTRQSPKVWPVILISIVYLAPESPWWLIRRGRLDEARTIMKRLTSARNINYDLEKNLKLMVATTEDECALDSRTTYWACLSGPNLRRTLIVIGIYCIQTFNGNLIRGYSTYFLQQAGMATTNAFNMTILGFVWCWDVVTLTQFSRWDLLPLFGRRTIYFWGVCLMFVLMLLIGSLGVPQAQTHESAYSWAIGCVLISSSFLYNCSIGPLTNTLCSEIPSALLRSKALAISRWTYVLTGIVAGPLTPYMLNPTAWNWSAKTGFFWPGPCFLSAIFTFSFVPETKNRTTTEMDLLFEMNITPRAFFKQHVNLTATANTNVEEVGRTLQMEKIR
ncbi:uncharacterized protein A1O9_03241 [Exophiala aquamarina CBS 119918]|uniref:Major facilitator superfamily (MFS) profile domain-containing protein n=1 Tax=Exophiala aquamarina CBS 119918 TaxID=1182545 RepID=A0A072PQR2_9EURO|nr:uncharacterized protein A1O9_03241 [Exophiala aquamarina CBS 119918]KEF61673.1 hypothetical protein A1O9_03241 [Exophiala aquamarina CBS 119918]